MTIIFGTLGFTPDKLLPTLRNHDDVERLVFYHDVAPQSEAAAKVVKRFCGDYDLKVESVRLDAFDIIECAIRMRKDLRLTGAQKVVFNITGGTPVISSAATLACILEGVRAVYIDERDKTEKSLPLLRMRYEDVLNPEQARVLRFVFERRVKGCTQAEILQGLKLSRGTVSYHVKNLKIKQLLQGERVKDDARKEILRTRESASLLLLEDLG